MSGHQERFERPDKGMLGRDEELERALRAALRDEAPASAPVELRLMVRAAVQQSPRRRRGWLGLDIARSRGGYNRFLAMATSGAAVAVVVALLASIVSVDHRQPGGPPATAVATRPAPTTVSRPIPIGNLIGAPVLAAGSLWAPENGTGLVLRIHPASQTVEAAVPVGVAASPAILAHGDRLWAAGRDADGWAVVGIDPASSEVVERIPVAYHPTAFAASGDVLWIASKTGNRILRVDLSERAVVHESQVLGNVSGIAAAEDGIWASLAQSGRAVRIDPATNNHHFLDPQPAMLDLQREAGVALSEDGAWVTGLTPRTIVIFSRATYEIVDRINLQQPLAIARAGNRMWVIDGPYDSTSGDPRLVAIDIDSRQIVETFPLPAFTLPAGLAVEDDGAWLVLDGTLHRLEIEVE